MSRCAAGAAACTAWRTQSRPTPASVSSATARTAFARFLERPDVLDAAGGTDIFHMPAGRVKLTAGADAVRCLQFSGKVFRWYTDCCRTPIGNTAGPRFPVIGLIHSFMDAGGRTRDELLGAPLCRLFDG